METLRKTWNQNNQPTLNQKFRSTTKKQSESCKEVPNQQHAQQLKVAELEVATLTLQFWGLKFESLFLPKTDRFGPESWRLFGFTQEGAIPITGS